MLGVPLTGMFFVLLAVAMSQGMWRWRRTAVLGLVLILGIFTFGTAVHSVHHLSDPAKAAECPVFSASQHLSGTLAEPSDVYASVLTISTALCSTGDVPILTFSVRSDLPRAPPSFPV